MVGIAENFLRYNTDSVMKNLLALEDHLRNLSSQYESEDASCLMKHSLQLEEQADEGISHASELEDREKVSVFHDLQEGARHLREQFKSRVNPSSLIVEVRKLRKRAEALDPTFNLEKCKSCGSAEGFLEEFKATDRKGLYPRSVEHNSSEHEMDSKTKDIALVIGGVNLGWGAGYAAKEYIDPLYPYGIGGTALLPSPVGASLLVDIGGTALGIVGALKLKKELHKKLAGYFAAGLSTHLWEDLVKLMPATPAARLSAAYSNAVGYPTVGVGAVGTQIPAIPGMPYPAQRLAEYPFASPVSVGTTMSPPHYTLNGTSGLKNVVLGPKYTLDT